MMTSAAEISIPSPNSPEIPLINNKSNKMEIDDMKVQNLSQSDVFSQESYETQTQTQTQKLQVPQQKFEKNQWALLKIYDLSSYKLFFCTWPNKQYCFGRHKKCNYRINGNYVSSVHFKLELKINEITKEYYVEIENIGKNGTTVNSIMLKEHQKLTLSNNDSIVVRKEDNQSCEIIFVSNPSFNTNERTINSKYELKDIIGSGSFATVKKAVRKSDGAEFAIKIIDTSKFHFNEVAKIGFKREIELLQKLHHKNIIKFCECIQEGEKVYLVTELMKGGSLLNLIEEKKGIPEIETRILYKQILEGVKYLHDNNITHRDIKPDNILLEIEKYNNYDSFSQNIDVSNDFKVIVKIGDFGTAKGAGLQTVCGTPYYLAPEIRRNQESKKFYNSKVDCWSLGIVLYQMLSNLLPYDNYIEKPEIDFTKNIWTSVSFNVLDIIENLLIEDSEKRFSVDQVLNHEWFNMMAEDIINEPKLIRKKIKNWGMLTYNEKNNQNEEYMKFDSDIILLGGNKRCTVYLPYKDISQLHLMFQVKENVAYIIDKSKNSNKVFIDDRIMEKNKPVILNKDCNIKLTDSDDHYYKTEFVINLNALKKIDTPYSSPGSNYVSPELKVVKLIHTNSTGSRKRKYSNDSDNHYCERYKRSSTVRVHNSNNNNINHSNNILPNKKFVSISHNNSVSNNNNNNNNTINNNQNLEPSFANLSLSNDDVWLELIPINPKYSRFYIKDNKKSFKIGRNQECTIQINSLYISNFHAEVKNDSQGNVFLVDKSSNGTYINHIKKKNQTIKLNNNDKVVFIYKDYESIKDDKNVEVGYIFSFKQ